jgi:hypothetical protein
MGFMSSATRVRAVALTLTCAAILVTYLLWFRSSDAPPAWKTVEFNGVRVDIPTSWNPVTANECEFRFAEHRPDSNICVLTPGISIFGSALFDPYRLPGLTHEVQDGKTVWAGYVYAGDMVVSTSSFDREVAQRVLDSARPKSPVTQSSNVSSNPRESLPTGSTGSYTLGLHCGVEGAIEIDGRGWEPAWRGIDAIRVTNSAEIDHALVILRRKMPGQELRGMLTRTSRFRSFFTSPDLPEGMDLAFKPTTRVPGGCS